MEKFENLEAHVDISMKRLSGLGSKIKCVLTLD